MAPILALLVASDLIAFAPLAVFRVKAALLAEDKCEKPLERLRQVTRGIGYSRGHFSGL